MKRVFLRFSVFVLSLILLDLAFGMMARPLLLNEPDAGNNHSNFKQSLFNKKAELLILGASKANHHYITDSLRKEFNMTVYNAGVDGDNIVTSFVQFEALKEKLEPKMVIIDLSGGQMSSKWESVFLTHKCYYGLSSCYSDAVDKLLSFSERIKLHSSLYKLNEEIPDIIQSYIIGDNNCDGFIPLIGSNASLAHTVKDGMDTYRIGDIERACLDSIIQYCAHSRVEVYIVYSPTLISYTNGITESFADYCEAHHLPFFNFDNDTTYTHYPEYFKDYNHLNVEGARLFTSDIITKIKSICNSN